MGDKEKPAEAEEENETEMKMLFHCPPSYPLPEGIKQMAHSETLCRYCGVSYLIYHEFHQLHTRLAQLEVELQKLGETAQRERTRREALELGRQDWEKALLLEIQRQAEEKEKRIREELEGRSKDVERVLREELEEQHERRMREMEKQYQKITEEKESQLRSELGDLEVKRLRMQREELEKVQSDALQKANKDLDSLRKQLEERLVTSASMKQDAEQQLSEERQQCEILRDKCALQRQALQAVLYTLRSSGAQLAVIRGFLSQLTGAWQDFRSQILQHSTQVFSVMREELRNSSVALQKMREEKEQLTQQLMVQKRWRVELLHQQRGEREQLVSRLKAGLEEKHERWLSCQRRCKTIQEQLSSLQQGEEQMNRKCRAAEKDATRLRETLEKVQQEATRLRRERETMINSHDRALAKMEEDCRKQMASNLAAALEEERAQSSLHLRKQMKELHKEAELVLKTDREKNQMLLVQHQQDNKQLQRRLQEREQELKGLWDELQEEQRSRLEERRARQEQVNQERQLLLQQEALRLSQAEAEFQLMTERSTELQEEVVLLQETIRRECEEREGLTAALCQAQEEHLRLRSSRSLPHPTETHAHPGNKHLHLRSQSRIPLTRFSCSPNTLRPSPDTPADRSTNEGGTGRNSESWSLAWMLSGEKRQEGTLPRLTEVKHKVSLMMERKERL